MGWICIIVIVGSLVEWTFLSYIFSWFPFKKKEDKSIGPPRLAIKCQTLEQVKRFMKSDRTRNEKYRKYYNCVEYSWNVQREAQWHGLVAFGVTIRYEDLSAHQVVAFPITSKKGTNCLAIYEPQTGEQIKPRVGEKQDGQKIIGMYLLRLLYERVPLDGSTPEGLMPATVDFSPRNAANWKLS